MSGGQGRSFVAGALLLVVSLTSGGAYMSDRSHEFAFFDQATSTDSLIVGSGAQIGSGIRGLWIQEVTPTTQGSGTQTRFQIYYGGSTTAEELRLRDGDSYTGYYATRIDSIRMSVITNGTAWSLEGTK